ncbi:MAG: hypothetical protein Q9203_000123 [Teloschistes exilis]
MPASPPPSQEPTSFNGRTRPSQLHDPPSSASRPNLQPANPAFRKPTPSPLQISESFSMTSNGHGLNDGAKQTPFGAPYPSDSSHSSPHSPCSPLTADRDQPKSPRERLDDLVAAGGAIAEGSMGGPVGFNMANGPAKTGSYHQLRTISSPVPLSKSRGSSPPMSPVRTASTPFAANAVRPDLRNMPRTSSIDSAISSISSAASHSNKSSIDSNTSAATDITHLINTAGSPEALVQHLLREKQYAAAQNDQLWKLVNKQRTLVLGLNQDLERALKDKERYRKKLKEHLAQVPPVPDSAMQTSRLDARDDSRSSLGDSSDKTPKQRSRDRDTVILDPNGTTKVNSENVEKVPDATVSMSSKEVANGVDRNPSAAAAQVSTATTAQSSDANRLKRMVLPIQTNDLDRSKTQQSDVSRFATPGSQSIDAVVSPNSFTAKRSLPLAQRRPSNPTLQLIESTPPNSANERSQLPFRKLPPAPLDLRPAQKEAQYGPDDHSGSDYEENVEVDELPALERGRRKTREEDDLDREQALLREQEDRSRSKKSKGSKPPSEPAPSAAAQLSMPPAIKGLSPDQSATVESSTYVATPGSLAGILSVPETQPSTIRSKTLTALPLSPGLPVSPRPIDRPMKSPAPRIPREGVGVYGSSPPVSPRNGFVGLPLSPRAPRQPIPMPPHTPMSMVSPMITRSEPRKDPTQGPQEGESPEEPQSETVSFDRPKVVTPEMETPQPAGIFRGLVSDAYPGLLIPPNALPSINVKVNSSRLKPSRHSYLGNRPSEEEAVFTLGISARSDMRELWQVEKTLVSLPHLDHQIKRTTVFEAKLPDRSLFSGHAPAKVDARRAALEKYFEAVLDTPMDEQAAIVLCRYLSTHAIDPASDENGNGTSSVNPGSPVKKSSDGRLVKEGYLTKRGKNFGGWKTRFFVLDEPVLRYYESPGGAMLGTIKLQNARIGKQMSSHPSSHSPPRTGDDGDSQYRHAFMIMEPKRKDSSSHVRHTLCAESDAERDAWVDALFFYVEGRPIDEQARPQLLNLDTSSSKVLRKHIAKRDGAHTESPDSATFEGLQALSYDSTLPAQPPVISIIPQRSDTKTPSPPLPDNASSGKGQQASKLISGPSNGTKIEDAGAWGNKVPQPKEVKEPKKRGIWGFRDKNPDLHAQAEESRMSVIEPAPLEIHSNARPTFGVPLAEAVKFCSPKGVDVCMPAVVYRCLEYLEAQDAASEEGIFRLSGSSVVIKALRDRFNNQGDFDFLADGQYYDVHAVASLLKLYLRELPSTVLTRELHLDFLAVLELDSKSKKIAAYNMLVHRLPKPNWTLIRALSAFLIEIVNNSVVNKMSVRNVGIVFSPTLNIPAPVFSMFLTDFDAIFGEEPGRAPAVPTEVVHNEPLTPEDIRSPRRQMFSEIPTPSYNQPGFPSVPSYEQLPQPQPRPSTNDTGFVPMQPSYEGQVVAGPEPGVTSRSLTPNSAAKARRRESSMLLMSGNPRKSSMPLLRGDSGKTPTHRETLHHPLSPKLIHPADLVREEQAFS